MLSKPFFQKLLPILVAFFLAISSENLLAKEEHGSPAPEKLSYVIIGAFSFERNAVRFVEQARAKGLSASYGINVNQQLYYVYVFNSPSLNDAKGESQKIRTMPEYYDAWVFTGVLREIQNADETLARSVTSKATPPEKLSYVVIGAFSYERNAVRFVERARAKGLSAEYAINVDQQLHYVYVFNSRFFNDAKGEYQKIRTTMPEYHDVWVFTGVLGEIKKEIESLAQQSNDVEEAIGSVEIPEEENKEAPEEEAPSETVISEARDIDPEENFYYLYLNTINVKNLREVRGRVKIIDLERLKQIDLANSHEIVELKNPNNGTGRIKLATDMFGFKEVQHEINLNDPLNDQTRDFVELIGDSIIVDFELHRFQKDDILVMYNVYFHIDAAIMEPESIYELNSLLDMLEENKKLQVRINGHTNGNSYGKIIEFDPIEKNYFSLNAKNKVSFGSAKKLSLSRARTIRQWLVDQGISEDRLDVKGWGGRKMIYGKHDTQAKKNVRVEILITDD